MPVEVFIAYSHADEPMRQELVKHLSPLKRSDLIEEWHDRCIEPGADWNREIDRHLNSSRIVLPLISADFIHSDYCYGVEMKIRNCSGEFTSPPGGVTLPLRFWRRPEKIGIDSAAPISPCP